MTHRAPMLPFIVMGVLAAALCAANAQTEVVPFQPFQPVVPASSPNEQARFLSGLRVPQSSPLFIFQKDPAYLHHVHRYAPTWRKFDERYFSRMRRFSATEILPRTGNPQTVYYLFGGPDFINAYALFPNASVYILGGLEPVGSMIPPEQLDPARIAAGLENLRKATSATLQFTIFITKDMKVDLDKTDFKGVMPILYSFLSLAGCEILHVSAIGINGAGSLVESGGSLPGIRIQFRKNPAAPTQTLYYVRADVSDGALGANAALLKWMGRFQGAVSYLKAASYLMHESYFSRVRNFLLSHSGAILQDDSGIPLKYFLNGEWQLTFFGSYMGTLDLFKKYHQPDLQQVFAAGQARELPFGTGYKWREGESNLMLAVKQAAAPPAAPEAPYPTQPAATPNRITPTQPPPF